MKNVGKASVVDQNLVIIAGYTQERNFISVRDVGRPSLMLAIFRTIRESTLGRSRSSVISVVRAFVVDQHLIVIA